MNKKIIKVIFIALNVLNSCHIAIASSLQAGDRKVLPDNMGFSQELQPTTADLTSQENIYSGDINPAENRDLVLSLEDGDTEFVEQSINGSKELKEYVSNRRMENFLKENFVSFKFSEDIYNLFVLHILRKSSGRRTLLYDQSSFSFKEELDLYISTGITFSAQVLCLAAMFNSLIEDTMDRTLVEHSNIYCGDDTFFEECRITNGSWDSADKKLVTGKALSMFVTYTLAWAFLKPNTQQISRLSWVGSELMLTEKDKRKLIPKITGLAAVAGSQFFIVTTTFWLMSNIAYRSYPLIDTILEGIGLVILNEMDDFACYSFFKGADHDSSDSLFTYRSNKEQLQKIFLKSKDHLQMHDIAVSYSLLLMLMGRWLGYTFFDGQGEVLNPIFNISTAIAMGVFFVPPILNIVMALRHRCKSGVDVVDDTILI